MEHPIRLRVTDDLRRNRLTVGFRWLLVIPHLIWLFIWGIAVFFAVVVSWFATLFAGQTPKGLHDFIAQYLRYSTHVNGYLYTSWPTPTPASSATGRTTSTSRSRRRRVRTAG
jgi:hypothetical protein